MDRFEGPFHQSDLKSYLKCPRAFYYKRVMNLDREKVNLSALAGRAGHEAIEHAHLNNEWRPEVLNQVFIEALEVEKLKALDKGMELNGNLDVEKHLSMLEHYASKPWNREAKVLALESEFFFAIRPSKAEYQFAGRIDQLLEIPTALLRADYPEQFGQIFKDTVILHRDTKFGQRKHHTRFELALDNQFDVYAYAFKHGVFEDSAGNHKVFGIIPDFHVKYHLEDHIPYKSDGGTYLQDPDTGGRVPCDLVTEPCLLSVQENFCQGKRKSCPQQTDKKGNPYKNYGPYIKDEDGNFIPCDLAPKPCLMSRKENYCEGKRSWCTRQKRGPAMYFTTRPAARLETIPAELGRVCASIRMGHYPRQLGELCFNYCPYQSTCEAEVLEDLAA